MDIPFSQKSGSPRGEPTPQHGLPFIYLPKKVVREVVGGMSNSSLADKVSKGIFPPPDKIGSRSLWRSDVIAKWLTEQAQKAEAERDERAKAGRDQAQRLVKARQSSSAPARKPPDPTGDNARVAPGAGETELSKAKSTSGRGDD